MILKYKSTPTVVDGIKFSSKLESKRYEYLKELERENKISNLELQPAYLLQESFRKEGELFRKVEYVADFRYYDNEKKKEVVEDVKSFITEKDGLFRIKRKLYEYRYPTKLTIVTYKKKEWISK